MFRDSNNIFLRHESEDNLFTQFHLTPISNYTLSMIMCIGTAPFTQKTPSESFDSFKPKWVTSRAKWLTFNIFLSHFVNEVTHFGSIESNDSLRVFCVHYFGKYFSLIPIKMCFPWWSYIEMQLVHSFKFWEHPLHQINEYPFNIVIRAFEALEKIHFRFSFLFFSFLFFSLCFCFCFPFFLLHYFTL